MRRQSAQTGHDFTKWQPHSSAVEFERKRREHDRLHRWQRVLNILMTITILILFLHYWGIVS